MYVCIQNRYNARDKIQQGNFLLKNICAGESDFNIQKNWKKIFFAIKMYRAFISFYVLKYNWQVVLCSQGLQ